MKILHVVHIPFAIPYFIGDQMLYFKNNYDAEIHIACTSSDYLFKYSKKWSFIPFELDIKRKISPLHDLASIFRLYIYIKKNKFDVVVSHSPKGALIGSIAAYLSGIKVNIYVRHGLFYETSNGLKLHLYKKIEMLISYFSSKIICVSQSILEKSIEDNVSNPQKMIVLNRGTFNGIDAFGKFNKCNYTFKSLILFKLKFNIAKNDIVVGYVGRLSKDKGIVELYNAWLILRRMHENIKLILIGPFDERDTLEKSFIEKLKNDNSIILTGLINNTAPYYKLMDIFILPSYREGFPTVVLEASSMELPVLTTKKTGCVDSIIENTTGQYIEINQSDIANKINYYIHNEDIRNLHGKNGRLFVLKYFEQTIMWNFLKKQVYI